MTAWMDQAACLEIGDPDLWHPKQHHQAAAAKRVCRSCAVATECLIFAVETRQQGGVWGGLSDRERRGLTVEVVA